MRKELIFAIVGGAVLGLIIAFGIWRVNSTLNPKTAGKPGPEPSVSPKPEFAITIAKPQERQVVTENTVMVSGVTKPQTQVAISGEDEDYLASADADGAFEQKVSLTGGINEIVITAFDSKGASSFAKLTLIYSSEFSKETPPPAPTEASKEADSVREKVQQKVAEALKNPKAYLGTVTDIAESTLQIKSPSGEIQQVSTNKDATFIKTGKVSKEIKYSDIAIGDYIVAMGYKNGNNVLNAKRVLVMSAPASTSRKSLMAKITTQNPASLVLAPLGGGNSLKTTLADIFFIFSKKDDKWTKIRYTDLDEGDTIIATGSDIKDSFEARTIFLTQKGTPPKAQ